MKINKNIQLKSKHDKPIVVDLFYKDDKQLKPIVIFCHGYKGFKDWGAWNLVAEEFAKQHLIFAKFNFSHNGGTVKQPIDFTDLESFGKNNYSIELDDLETVIDWLISNIETKDNLDVKNITLIGHSRGGGIVTIKASEDNRVAKVISWAGVSDFGIRFPKDKELENWKEKGISYVVNGRTKQKMPHLYQFYKNFKENEARLTIKTAAEKMSIPHLIAHGTSDTSVPFFEAKNIHKWNPKSILLQVKNADHVFGCKHPWEQENLPENLHYLVKQTISFIKSN